jgi:hypothetical protein
MEEIKMWYIVKYYDSEDDILEGIKYDRSEIEEALSTPQYLTQEHLDELDTNNYVKVSTEGYDQEVWEGISYFTIEPLQEV